MHESGNVSLIVLDGNQVVYDLSEATARFYELFGEFLQRHGSAYDLASAANLWKEFERQRYTGKISAEEMRAQYLAKLGVSEYSDEYSAMNIEAGLKVRLTSPEIPGDLKVLKSRGYKLAILSDGGRSSADVTGDLERLDLAGIFDAVFISSEIHHTKPEREAYMAVLDSFHVSPHQSAFIGHELDELDGARRVGMRVMSYRETFDGYTTIRRLSEIADLLDSGSTG